VKLLRKILSPFTFICKSRREFMILFYIFALIYLSVCMQVNELKAYVSNHNKPLYTMSIEKNSGIVLKEVPGIPLEKRGSNFKSKSHNLHDEHLHDEHLHDEATINGQKLSQIFSSGSRFARGEHRTRRKSRKWGRWLDWSNCSVTCGKGRQIRWRHCVRDCEEVETEMEEKACQLPACPKKFLGIF